jgi:predicted porin
MGADTKENKPSTDRYAALGLDYQVGGLEVGFLVDYTNKNSSAFTSKEYKGESVSDNIDKNSWTVNLAANYDCGFAKTFIAAQYFKNVTPFGSYADDIKHDLDDLDDTELAKQLADELRLTSLKGYGVNLGADIPAFGGNFMVSVGYADGDIRFKKHKDGSIKGYTGLAGYTYPISKRTNVYAGAGYTRYEFKGTNGDNWKDRLSVFQAMAGLKHTF